MIRPILKESHKPSPKQMMSLLGMEWRKLSKPEQQDWTKRAVEESTDPHQEGAEEHSLQEQQQTVEVVQGSVQAVPEVQAGQAFQAPQASQAGQADQAS